MDELHEVRNFLEDEHLTMQEMDMNRTQDEEWNRQYAATYQLHPEQFQPNNFVNFDMKIEEQKYEMNKDQEQVGHEFEIQNPRTDSSNNHSPGFQGIQTD